jgi:hypothetical protein
VIERPVDDRHDLAIEFNVFAPVAFATLRQALSISRESFLKVTKTFLGGGVYLSFSPRKQCILSRLYTTALLRLLKKPYTLEGFEPGFSVPEADEC